MQDIGMAIRGRKIKMEYVITQIATNDIYQDILEDMLNQSLDYIDTDPPNMCWEEFQVLPSSPDAHKYQAHEVLNRVLNSGETALQVDIVAGAEYAEDSGHTSTDTGNFILGVRNDTLAALGGTDGDYVPFQMNADGALYVEISSGGANDSIYVDDADWTDSTSKHTLVGGLYQSSPQTITDGDTGPLQVNANGNLIVDLSATDNAVLDAMVVDLAALETLQTSTNTKLDTLETTLTAIETDQAAIETLLTAANVDHAANEVLLGTIDADTNAIKGHVDGIETLITSTNSKIDTFDAVLDNILTKNTEIDAVLDTIDADTSTLAAAVSTEMQVDVVGSLPAGSAAIGKLAANSGVDIGDVDVTSVVPGVAATSLGKAIQSAQGGTDTGVAALVVRNDVLADLSGADGDYAPLQVDKSGALYTIESTGQLGSLFEDGTEDITSKQIIAIQFLEDTTFTTLTPSGSNLYIGTANQDGDAIDTSNVFPQGMTIFGRWTGYRLASGSIIAYKGTF